MMLNILTSRLFVGSVDIAEQNRDFVIGFVCQSRISDDQGFVYLTPGKFLLTGV
jgi:hypothetical protein